YLGLSYSVDIVRKGSNSVTVPTLRINGDVTADTSPVLGHLSGGVYKFLVNADDSIIATRYLDVSVPTSITSTSTNSCGTTSPTLSTGSGNSRGSFVVGATSGTDCTLTFSTAAANAWICSPSDETSSVLIRAISVNTTSTKFHGVVGAGDT